MIKALRLKEFAYNYYENKKNVNVNKILASNTKLIPFISEVLDIDTGITIVSFDLIKIRSYGIGLIDSYDVPEIETTASLDYTKITKSVINYKVTWSYNCELTFSPELKEGYYYYTFTDSQGNIYCTELFNVESSDIIYTTQNNGYAEDITGVQINRIRHFNSSELTNLTIDSIDFKPLYYLGIGVENFTFYLCKGTKINLETIYETQSGYPFIPIQSTVSLYNNIVTSSSFSLDCGNQLSLLIIPINKTLEPNTDYYFFCLCTTSLFSSIVAFKMASNPVFANKLYSLISYYSIYAALYTISVNDFWFNFNTRSLTTDIKKFAYEFYENKGNITINKIIASSTNLKPFTTRSIAYDISNTITDFNIVKLTDFAENILTGEIESTQSLDTNLILKNILGNNMQWYYFGFVDYAIFATGFYYFYVKDSLLNEFYSEIFYINSDASIISENSYLLAENGYFLLTENSDNLIF